MTNYEYYNKNGISFNTVNNEYLAFCNKNKKNISFEKWIHSERKFEPKYKIGDIICNSILDECETSVVIGFIETNERYLILTMDYFSDIIRANMHGSKINELLKNNNYSFYADDIIVTEIECRIGTVDTKLIPIAETIGKHYSKHYRK